VGGVMVGRAQRLGQHSKYRLSKCSHSKCSHGSTATLRRATGSSTIVSSEPWVVLLAARSYVPGAAWPPPPSSRSRSSGRRLRGRARQGAPTVEAGVGKVGRVRRVRRCEKAQGAQGVEGVEGVEGSRYSGPHFGGSFLAALGFLAAAAAAGAAAGRF
jgi:hypothetical protein